MSGHSKWANIKGRKEAQDKKRAQVFTKLTRAIVAAAREGSPDPETNAKLRLAIDRARSFNVPKDNIERAIRREGSEIVESFAIDAIGPGGINVLIEGATSSRNRTISDLRHLLQVNGGKIAEGGGAHWAFERKGLLTIERGADEKDSDELTLAAIESGAEDVRESDEALEVIVPPESLDRVKQALEGNGVPVADATLGWVPRQTVALAQDQRAEAEKLFTALDDHEDVQAIWSNEI